MDLLAAIEEHKHVILEEFYALFPAHFFKKDCHITGSKIPMPKLCTHFRKLEDLISTANQQWWDKFFLQSYIQHKISPRGLRVLKQCAFLDPDLHTEWAHVSEFCTAKWMGIIIQQRDRKYMILKDKIITLCKTICDTIPHLPFTWFSMLKRNTIRNEDNTIASKLGKFRRDLFDYNTNQVFSWKHTKNPNQGILPGPRPLMSIRLHENTPGPSLKPQPRPPPHNIPRPWSMSWHTPQPPTIPKFFSPKPKRSRNRTKKAPITQTTAPCPNDSSISPSYPAQGVVSTDVPVSTQLPNPEQDSDHDSLSNHPNHIQEQQPPAWLDNLPLTQLHKPKSPKTATTSNTLASTLDNDFLVCTPPPFLTKRKHEREDGGGDEEGRSGKMRKL